MNKKAINIYMTGVGGQGIGLLSELLLRAADYAGFAAKGVDTHGLAQRGGIVVSHLRLGKSAFSPLIMKEDADIVIALERHEALRGMNDYLKDNGTLIYYDTVWQPLGVRLNQAEEISGETVTGECRKRNIREIKVFEESLKDPRQQNIVILAEFLKNEVISELRTDHFRNAMEDLLSGDMLKSNVELFLRLSRGH